MTKLQDVPKSRLTEFTAPTQQLTEYGVDVVHSFVWKNFRYDCFIPTIGLKEYDTVLVGEETYRGRFITRLESWLYKNRGITFTDEQRHWLGMVVAQNMLGGDLVRHYDVVDFIRWRPGSFKENSFSCWWNSYRDGKNKFIDEMKRNEAAAIRLFRPATPEEVNRKGLKKWYKTYVGVGRCFAVLNNPIGVDIIFNGYGLDYLQWGTLIQQIFDYKYQKRIGLYMNNIYVNGGVGIALSDDPITISQFDEPNFGKPYHPCKNCNKPKQRFSLNYCQSCFESLHVKLTWSGRWVAKQDAVQLDNVTGAYGGSRTVFTDQIELDRGVYVQCLNCGKWCQPSYRHAGWCGKCVKVAG